MDKPENIKSLKTKQEIKHFNDKIMNLDMKEVETLRDVYYGHFSQEGHSN